VEQPETASATNPTSIPPRIVRIASVAISEMIDDISRKINVVRRIIRH
jgi:hypothetical protein